MTQGERIRKWRKSKGLSVTELAKHLHVTKAYVSQTELGYRAVSEALIDKLRVMGLDLGKPEPRQSKQIEYQELAIPHYHTIVRVDGRRASYEEAIESFNVIAYFSQMMLYTMHGEAMRDAGILHGMVVVARQSDIWSPHDIVVCSHNGELMCRGITLVNGKVWLVPFGSGWKPVEVKDTDDMEVRGIVEQVVCRPNRDVWEGVAIPTT